MAKSRPKNGEENATVSEGGEEVQEKRVVCRGQGRERGVHLARRTATCAR